ncbi:MAG TPA: GspE/PulE family protein [Verrucomicrobiae bacterium]|nr:GspE/PulE family protein [Verrucomicrobiae bacterium]
MALSGELRAFRPEGEAPAAPFAARAAADAPAVRAVDEILQAAAGARASDVHLEPTVAGGRIRERIDGVLREAGNLPESLYARVLSRIKLLSGMDISDRRLPQDGRYSVEYAGRTIDARVSSMPTIDGERVVVRLLDVGARIPTLEEIGLEPRPAAAYRRVMHAPSGFVVICGPTGSGKTTTAYASLAERNVPEQHLCSVEDPVEVRIPGVAQVSLNLRAGLTFASAMRGFLRQDPNVIMIGELRDAEAAAIAGTAALCGSLIVTTLHSASAVGAIERLLELEMPARRIAAGLSAVVAQRLMRRLCNDCKVQAVDPGGSNHAAIFEPRGCERCGGCGYRGRCAAFDVLVIDDELRSAIGAGQTTAQLNAIRGAKTAIRSAAQRLVERGETSVEEFSRVIGTVE